MTGIGTTISDIQLLIRKRCERSKFLTEKFSAPLLSSRFEKRRHGRGTNPNFLAMFEEDFSLHPPFALQTREGSITPNWRQTGSREKCDVNGKGVKKKHPDKHLKKNEHALAPHSHKVCA